MRPFSLMLASAATALATGINDFSCKSTVHANPIVFLHGLGATYYEDLNFLQGWLQSQGYCTYAKTYGAYEFFPFVGGLKAIDVSAREIASYITQVAHETGADKVDLVGHSEGAFQTLYVSKFEKQVTPLLERLVAIAPPTHGTSLDHLYDLASIWGNATKEAVNAALHTVGCAACADLGPSGAAVKKLDDGAILQPGTKLTVIASKHDELVTPPTTSFVQEDGVTNIWVQDVCPNDPVGHIGEAYDMNVWNLVKNALDETPDRKFECKIGAPGK